MNQFLKFRVQLLIAFDFLVLQANDKKLDDVHFNLCMKCIDNTTVCGNEILRQKFKQRLETYCFCSVSYYYYFLLLLLFFFFLSARHEHVHDRFQKLLDRIS
jgi:hypothetical protein